MSAGNIKVELNYNRDNGIRPFKFGRPRTQKEQMIFHADEGGPRKFVPSLVRNARNGNFSLDKNSFELIKDQSSLSTNDFYNTQLIEKVYYKANNARLPGYVQKIESPQRRRHFDNLVQLASEVRNCQANRAL